MDRTVAHLNIEYFCKLLANETDETKRQMLLRLLAEEEAKLKGFDPKLREPKKDPKMLATTRTSASGAPRPFPPFRS
jgi:hypothetical protein